MYINYKILSPFNKSGSRLIHDNISNNLLGLFTINNSSSEIIGLFNNVIVFHDFQKMLLTMKQLTFKIYIYL